MIDSKELLVVTHPILGDIHDDEIEKAIPEAQRAAGWRRVDVVPVRTRLAELHRLDWGVALAAQERLFTEEVEPLLPGRARLAYFGFAPIPLALHLGYRFERGYRIDVYQKHHERVDWVWMPDAGSLALPAMKPLVLPDHGSTDVGHAVIRVSTSHSISRLETAEIVSPCLAEVDVALAEPHEDALSTPEALGQVVRVWNRALGGLKSLFPRLSAIHVFVAAPVGMVFKLGTQINPTIYPEVITYQYGRLWKPAYREAIVLTEKRDPHLPEMRSGGDGGAMLVDRSGRLLPHADILTLVEAAVDADVVNKAGGLFAGIDPNLLSQLPDRTSPVELFIIALAMMNRVGILRDGTVPLRVCLMNAIALTKPRAETAVFERFLAKLPPQRP